MQTFKNKTRYVSLMDKFTNLWLFHARILYEVFTKAHYPLGRRGIFSHQEIMNLDNYYSWSNIVVQSSNNTVTILKATVSDIGCIRNDDDTWIIHFKSNVVYLWIWYLLWHITLYISNSRLSISSYIYYNVVDFSI